MEDALDASENPNQIAVNLLQVLGVDGDAEADEHVWLSLKNAKIFCAYIAEQLTSLDPERAQVYADNLDAYTERLDALDADYQTAVEESAGNPIIFGDRFPFQYLFDDYGLAYFAAYAGCSAEAEVSFDTVITPVSYTHLHSVSRYSICPLMERNSSSAHAASCAYSAADMRRGTCFFSFRCAIINTDCRN